jgi:hypothetical protein
MPSETRAVNLYREPYDVYAGRPRGEADPRDIAVGEHGCLGNPFPLGNRRRGSTLDRYRQYFLARVDSEPEFRAYVLSLAGQRLGCFCSPKPCHAEIIAAWVDRRPERQPAARPAPLTLFD